VDLCRILCNNREDSFDFINFSLNESLDDWGINYEGECTIVHGGVLCLR
jgi:hypothetical protein